jgi:hypothetical protein
VLLQVVAALAALAAWAGADAARRVRAAESDAAVQAALVARLGLTDACLFTDARYTRHLSQSDAFSAFQDHPRALEHFPSGSVAGRPE